MRVEEEPDDELLGSVELDMIPGVRSRRMDREAARLYDLLLATGVSRGDAKANIIELYSPRRVTAEIGTLPNMSLAGGSTFDLRADENGVSWDFRFLEHRRRARARIVREQPFLVVGSPP